MALLIAMRLTAAAFGCDFSPFSYLGLDVSHAARAWLLALAVGVLATLVWLVLRHGDRTLWLSGPSGGVLASAADLEDLVEAAACRHPEVVHAEARLRIRAGAPAGTLRVFCRPLADPARVATDVSAEARRELLAVSGREPADLSVRPRVLAVRQLKRYLP